MKVNTEELNKIEIPKDLWLSNFDPKDTLINRILFKLSTCFAIKEGMAREKILNNSLDKNSNIIKPYNDTFWLKNYGGTKLPEFYKQYYDKKQYEENISWASTVLKNSQENLSKRTVVFNNDIDKNINRIKVLGDFPKYLNANNSENDSLDVFKDSEKVKTLQISTYIKEGDMGEFLNIGKPVFLKRINDKEWETEDRLDTLERIIAKARLDTYTYLLHRTNDYFKNLTLSEIEKQEKYFINDTVNILIGKEEDELKKIKRNVVLQKEKKIKQEKKQTLIEQLVEEKNIPITIAEFLKRDYKTNTDAAKGDVVLFTEAVFSGTYPNSHYEGDRRILGIIEKDSYGGKRGQHSFTIYVLDSDGEDSLNEESIINRKGRNVYKKDFMYIPLASQEVREEKHERGQEAKETKYWNWWREYEESKRQDKYEKIPEWFKRKHNLEPNLYGTSMITTQNYFAESSNILNQFSELQKFHDFVVKATKDGENWEQPPGVKKMIDSYITYINKVNEKYEKGKTTAPAAKEELVLLKSGQTVWFKDGDKIVEGEVRFNYRDEGGMVDLVYYPGGSRVGKIVKRSFENVFTEKPAQAEVKILNQEFISPTGNKFTVIAFDDAKKIWFWVGETYYSDVAKGNYMNVEETSAGEFREMLKYPNFKHVRDNFIADIDLSRLVDKKKESVAPGEKKKEGQVKYTVWVWTNPDYKSGRNFVTEEEAKAYIKQKRKEDSALKFRLEKFKKQKSVTPGAKKALKAERAKPKAKPVKEKKEKVTKEKKVGQKQSKQKTTKAKKVKEGTAIEKVDEEHKIIARFVNLNGKEKHYDQLMNFHNYIEKAVLEKRLRAASPLAKEIEYIDREIVKAIHKMEKEKSHSITLSLSEKEQAHYGTIARSQYPMPSIQLLKRYVTMHGRKITKEKAQKLLAQLNLAVQKGKVTKADPYAEQANQAWKNLTEFLKNHKRGDVLKIYEAELRGLEAIGCCAMGKPGKKKNLKEGALGIPFVASLVTSVAANLIANKITKPGDMKGVVSSESVKDTEVKTIGLTGRWKTLMGDPSNGFSVLVYGEPKGGKSTLSLIFAKHLAENHGNTLFITAEEGVKSPSFIKKIKDHNIEHSRLFFADAIPADLGPYEFIFVDSLNMLNLGEDEIAALKKKHPQKNFIFIAQSRKDGNYRGSEGIKHLVDTVVEVESGIATGYGRFNAEGKINIFDNPSEQLAVAS